MAGGLGMKKVIDMQDTIQGVIAHQIRTRIINTVLVYNNGIVDVKATRDRIAYIEECLKHLSDRVNVAEKCYEELEMEWKKDG